MKYNKRASLNLSINAIVILILAITMLGLGLGFMKNLFTKTTGQLADVGEDIKNQMITELRRSNAKLTLDQEDIVVNTGSTKDIYFGVKNVLQQPTDFGILIECPDALVKEGDEDMIKNINHFTETRVLDNGEIDVQKLQINVPSTYVATTWSCKLTLGVGDVPSSDPTVTTPQRYDSKSFFITVER